MGDCKKEFMSMENAIYEIILNAASVEG